MNFPGVLISPLVEIMKCLSAPIVRRIVYIKDLKKNFDMLKEKARDLFSKKDDIKNEINRHGIEKMATRECENWLNKVEEIENHVNEIEEEYNREDRRCLRGWCLNIQSQWKLSKHLVVTMNCISNLIEESNSVRGATVDALPQVAEAILAPTINDESSTNRNLRIALECVKNLAKHRIGIWGMGGVGKTTVMKNLNNLTEVKQIFDIVIWVTVSKDCSLRKIQNEIAKRLLLGSLNDESDERVARKLYEHLKTKKFLLLMDDVWDKVDLDDVGIPCPNQNGSKVVLTTRYRRVCNKMETDEEIKVEPLPFEEAWKLFCEKVGDVADLPTIHPVARAVLAECDGLPLAIITVGASLRKEDNIYVWNNALKELSSPASSNIEDMEEQVFKRLKFSFDRLKDDNLKNCFLYGALYPEDYPFETDEIIDYWMVEGLISSSLNLVEMHSKGQAILKELIDASLLESTGLKRTVKMHDVIRDLALRITSAMGEGCKFFVRVGARIKQHSEKEWENVERISLMNNEFCDLPKRPYCPNLLTLLLQKNKKLTRIPKSFFNHMHSLRVLDLSGTDIDSLPASICSLVSLRGLYLKYCNWLKALPPEIGALTSLEVLDLSNSGNIIKLPSEIGELAHLRVLQFSFPPSGEYENVMITGGTIARLSLLEWLTAFVPPLGFVGFCWGADHYSECAVAIIKDICCLKKLMYLNFFFPEVKYLEYFLQRSSPWKEGCLLAFNFVVGHLDMDTSEGKAMAVSFPEEYDQWSKSLTFYGGESIPDAIMEVLGYAHFFTLAGHGSIRRLCQFRVANLNNLIHCVIDQCFGMETILDSAWITGIALPNLVALNISRLPNLKGIWSDPLPPRSLACLRKLQVSYCRNLKKLFSRETIQQLENLEDVTVQHCSSLKEVITEEVSCMLFECKLPNLRRLSLFNLPALVCISKGCSLTWPSFEDINVYNCRNLKRLPQGICKAPKLREIQCSGGWWNELEWEDSAIKVQLESASKVQLETIFSRFCEVAPEKMVFS